MKHFLIALLWASIFITVDTAQAKPRAGKKAKVEDSINFDDPNMQLYKNQQSTTGTVDIYNPSPEARINPVETIDRAPAEENSLTETEKQDP